ncbi:hypothetical protein GBZ48_02700 [Azospirillum melinis]|uniref:Uncharacterized protein n=1 Tax=Azospirillum melinis TaxID=328839 RepID=A0ABX2K4L0_9PROT|nr:hypothetical protein [Azospirillum melinis]MBP2306454.1 hypothetical protein [Azospirillum melinis]NUA98188.1 hypothetical protein [Azospirillum melinis]
MDKATRIGRSGVAGAAAALLFGWLRQGRARRPKHKPQQEGSNPDTRFEARDTPPWLFPVLGGLAAGLIVAVVVSLLLIFPNAARDENHALTTPMPEPRLQTDPVADLKRYKAQAMERLTGYGWADRAHGIAHIPINEAMRRVAEHGIADWPADARRGAQR